jgi:uncharacterized protein with GYD domain
MKFVLLGTISAKGAAKYKERGAKAFAKGKALGFKIEFLYYTQGPYDFVEVLDAPDAEAVLVMTTWFSKQGYGRVIALPAHDMEAMKRADKKAGP